MNTKNPNVLVLAHYYTSPQVQELADFVGDSLDLSLSAQEYDAERIVFCGVKFMAETARIINASVKQVILPDASSTCSLVTQVENLRTSVRNSDPALYSEIALRKTLNKNVQVVTYINSDYRLKAISDVIVTSANVEDIVTDLITSGKEVFFTPDRNMGAYLKAQNPYWDYKFSYYTDAVCEVHDKFAVDKIRYELDKWHNFGAVLLAHPESPLPVLKRATLVGSTRKMLEYVTNTSSKATIYVATEEGLLYNMRKSRPDLDIRLAPTYNGCQCNSCPYMQLNTVQAVKDAIDGKSGLEIDYIPEDVRLKALKPIERMLQWK